MKVKINGYELDQYCGGIASSQIFSMVNPTTGKAKIHTRALHIEGEVKGADQDAVNTQIEALEDAIESLGSSGDVGLTLNDGTTPSEHWLDGSNSQGGIRLVNFQWLPCIGTQYATRRNFQLVVEADYLADAANNLIQFEETIRRVGTGGPVFIYQPVLVGPWRKVTIHTQSTYVLVQSGANIGYESLEPPASPLFSDEHLERRTIDQNTGSWINGKKRNFTRTWSYFYESNNLFV